MPPRPSAHALTFAARLKSHQTPPRWRFGSWCWIPSALWLVCCSHQGPEREQQPYAASDDCTKSYVPTNARAAGRDAGSARSADARADAGPSAVRDPDAGLDPSPGGTCGITHALIDSFSSLEHCEHLIACDRKDDACWAPSPSDVQAVVAYLSPTHREVCLAASEGLAGYLADLGCRDLSRYQEEDCWSADCKAWVEAYSTSCGALVDMLIYNRSLEE